MMLSYTAGGTTVRSYEQTRDRLDAIYASDRPVGRIDEEAMSVLGDLIEDAHQAATDVPASELTSDLQDLLGRKLVAFAVGDRHPKTIGRYARGDRNPEATLG